MSEYENFMRDCKDLVDALKKDYREHRYQNCHKAATTIEHLCLMFAARQPSPSAREDVGFFNPQTGRGVATGAAGCLPQSSPSARDVALKCAEIAQITIIARARPDDDGADVAAAIRAFADTLGNESSPNLDPTAGLGPSDLTESAAVPSLGEAQGTRDGGNPAVDPARAADPAPEAAKKPSAFYSAPEVCHGCGKPLLRENAWMFDGCPCNSPAGVNDGNLYRWRLLSELQQQGAHRAAAAEQALARAQERENSDQKTIRRWTQTVVDLREHISKLDADLEKANAHSAPAETGWVIEDGRSLPPEMPRYWTGRGDWSYDSEKAMRWAREQDARFAMAAIKAIDPTPFNHSVVEHMWFVGETEVISDEAALRAAIVREKQICLLSEESEAPHPQPAHAADPAPEAWELTRERIEDWRTLITLKYRGDYPDAFATRHGPSINALCDMALRSLDLQQALARAQAENRTLWTRLNPSVDYVEGTPVGYAEDEIDRLHAAKERAEAELAKVREALGWYANPEHWKIFDVAGPEDPPDLICPADEDGGDCARAALASAPSAKEGQTGEQNEERKP